MCQSKILAFCVCYLFFENLSNFLAVFLHVGWLAHQILFSILIRVLNLISPIVHPVHTVEMRSRNEASLHLHPLQVFVMSLLLKLFLHFQVLPVYLSLFLFGLPHLLDVLHRSGMPDLLHQVIESHCRISSLKYYNITVIQTLKSHFCQPITFVNLHSVPPKSFGLATTETIYGRGWSWLHTSERQPMN